MLIIKVLGPGCDNCKKVEAVARKAVANLGVEAEFVKVTDWAEIKKYPILSTPGLVINEKLVCAGRIPNEDEVVVWLKEAQACLNPTGLTKEGIGIVHLPLYLHECNNPSDDLESRMKCNKIFQIEALHCLYE